MKSNCYVKIDNRKLYESAYNQLVRKVVFQSSLKRTMGEIDSRQDLIIHLADLDEPYVLKLVQQILNRRKDPLTIIKDCQQAMGLVGDR